eukprot:m.14706 g.14706  ORF g.14706 m.14706 type:complete len:441 (-) comp10256_c0_seq1:246-1568(-)
MLEQDVVASSEWSVSTLTAWNNTVSKRCQSERKREHSQVAQSPPTAVSSTKRAKYINLVNGFHARPSPPVNVTLTKKQRTFIPVQSAVPDRSAPSPPASPETNHLHLRENPLRPRRTTVPTIAETDADFHEVWVGLDDRERFYHANPNYITFHATMKRRMRSLLADWMIEVSDEFTLHRETYYVAMNFVDRYLSSTEGIHKSNVQLIGVACLFTAAKIQEIYPPRLSRFAELTDGACTEEEILQKEMHILKTLHWNLSPVTPIAWIEVYLKTAAMIEKPSTTSKYTQHDVFCGACKLLDFATLDYESVKFSPSVLAACALFLFDGSSIETFATTGFHVHQLMPCLKWMMLYAFVLEQHERENPEAVNNVERPILRNKNMSKEDLHYIQQYNGYSLELLERVVHPNGTTVVTPSETANVKPQNTLKPVVMCGTLTPPPSLS